MELHKFITSMLKEIQLGVSTAINETKGTGAINPAWGTTNDIGPQHVQNIEFDIAVTAVEKKNDSTEGGIKIPCIHIGGNICENNENSKIHRIKFSIPLIPPVTTISNDDN